MKTNVPHRLLSHLSLISVFLVGFAAIIFYVWRIQFGANFGDEAFYLTTPFRFFLGDKPFIDEKHIYQTSALLLFLPVKLWLFFFGNTDGIILGFRKLFLLFNFIVSMAVYQTFKKRLKPQYAWVVSVYTFSFFTSLNPTLSYNTMGFGFLFLATLTLYHINLSARPKKLPFLCAGIFSALSCLAYPTIVFVVSVLAVRLAWLYRNNIKNLIFYFLGLSLCPLFILMASDFNISLIFQVLDFVKVFEPARNSGFDVKSLVPFMYLLSSPKIYGVLAAILFFRWLGGRKQNRSLFIIPLIFLPLISFEANTARYGGEGQTGFVTLMAWITPLLIFRTNKTFARTLFFELWLPGFLAASICSATSHMGLTACANFFLISSIASLVLLLENMMQIEKTKYAWAPTLFSNIMILTAILYLRNIPGESGVSISSYTHRIHRGPFQNLRTTAEKAEFVEELDSIIKQSYTANKKLLTAGSLPAAYLSSPLKPAYPTTLATICWGPAIDYCRQLYESPANLPDMIIFDRKNFTDSSPFLTTFPASYSLFKQNAYFSIYKKELSTFNM